MTEKEWWECPSAGTRMSYVSSRVSKRKRLLFGVGCCYQIWRLLNDERSRTAVRIAERYADHEATRKELVAVHRAAREAMVEARKLGVMYDGAEAAWAASDPQGELECLAADCASHPGQHALLDDLLGDPFHPVRLHRKWLMPEVLTLAEGIYHHKKFLRMPMLAKALRNAGCKSDRIMKHCDEAAPHFRGCWVIDVLLGKE